MRKSTSEAYLNQSAINRFVNIDIEIPVNFDNFSKMGCYRNNREAQAYLKEWNKTYLMVSVYDNFVLCVYVPLRLFAAHKICSKIDFVCCK